MSRVTIEDALEYCLANPDGLGVEELLARFPKYREELQPLLALAKSVREVAAPPVPVKRRAAMKTRLMEAAAAQGGSARAGNAQQKRGVVQQGRKQGWIWGVLRRPVFAVAGLLTAMIILLWWGAAAALPDSPLYGVRLASENVMLNFGGGAGEKARDHLELASRRLDEIEATNAQGKLAAVDSAVKNFGEHVSAATTLWKETTDGENDAIKSNISGVITRFERVFKGFDGEVATLAESVREDIGQVYMKLSNIRVEINELPYMEVPQGIDIQIPPAPTPVVTSGEGTPVSGTATVPGPTEVATATATGASVATETPGSVPSATVPPLATHVATVVVPTSRPTSGIVVKSTATSTRRVVASPTSRPTGTRVPGRTNTPTRTSTISAGSQTPGPGGGVTPSSVPTRTYTPLYTATSTATAIQEIEASPTDEPPHPAPEVTAVNSPSLPHPSTPQVTTVPLPSNTALPTGVAPTNVAPTIGVPTIKPTPEGEPTKEACDLHIDEVEVEASCGTHSDVRWSADVENRSSSSTQGNWVAVLLVKGRTDGYQEVDRASGTATFPPRHSITLEDSFSYAVPGDAKSVRVQLTISSNGHSCGDNKQGTVDCDN